MVGAVFLHCPAETPGCVFLRFRFSPHRNPLDGCGKKLRLVKLHGLGAYLALVVVVSRLGLDVHPVALLQPRGVPAQIAENDDVLPVGAGLPFSSFVVPKRRNCDGEGHGGGAVGLLRVGSKVAHKGGAVQVVDHGVLLRG